MKDLLRIVADYREWVEGQSRDGLQSPLTARERVAILGFVGWLERTSPEYAAAPELLAACKALVDNLIWASGSSDFAPDGIAREGWLKVEPSISQGMAAIAKAEGEA